MVGILAVSKSFASCPSGQTEDNTSGHCIKQQIACSGKCTYYYDTTTHDFWVNKNAGIADGVEVLMDSGLSYFVNKNINNVTIGEGITGFARNSSGYIITSGLNGIATDGVLTLPSTLGNTSRDFFFNTQFSTIDASAMKNVNIDFARDGKDVNIILSQDSNVHILISDAYGSTVPYAVNIICKGNKQKCDSQVKTGITWPNIHNITKENITYYVGDDDNGNWEVWTDEGKMIYEDSSMQKLLAKYDFDGNQTGVYLYDKGGNLIKALENGVEVYRRRIYTPAEAASVVQNNKNKFSIIYR